MGPASVRSGDQNVVLSVKWKHLVRRHSEEEAGLGSAGAHAEREVRRGLDRAGVGRLSCPLSLQELEGCLNGH